MSKVRYGYMDMTDFEHELGYAMGGNRVYPSIKELLANEPCAKKCGIVKVKISVERVVPKEEFNENK